MCGVLTWVWSTEGFPIVYASGVTSRETSESCGSLPLTKVTYPSGLPVFPYPKDILKLRHPAIADDATAQLARFIGPLKKDAVLMRQWEIRSYFVDHVTLRYEIGVGRDLDVRARCIPAIRNVDE